VCRVNRVIIPRTNGDEPNMGKSTIYNIDNVFQSQPVIFYAKQDTELCSSAVVGNCCPTLICTRTQLRNMITRAHVSTNHRGVAAGR